MSNPVDPAKMTWGLPMPRRFTRILCNFSTVFSCSRKISLRLFNTFESFAVRFGEHDLPSLTADSQLHVE